MRIDVGIPLQALCGAELRDNQGNVLTLQKVMVEALFGLYPNYENINLQEKLARYNIAKRVFECKRINNIVELSLQEINVIKVLIGYAFPPLIVGRAIEELDMFILEDEMVKRQQKPDITAPIIAEPTKEDLKK